MVTTKVIQIFGGPGVGKSTIALGLAFALKKMRRETEYVSEYAKDLIWENRDQTLTYQYYLFAKQFRNIERVIGKVEFVVTDSPPLMSLSYADTNDKAFHDYVVSAHNRLNNLNVFVERVVPYSTVGRYQTEDQAIQKDADIASLLEKYHIPYEPVVGLADTAIDQILGKLDVR